jgi:DNA-binding transcriptional ArsR family regulator
MSSATVFKALSEPRRLELLQILRERGELSVGDMAERVDVTQQAVSLHLKVLEEAGLVQARREGTRHLYVVRTEGFRPAKDYLDNFWGDKLQALKTLVERKKR